MQYISTFVEKRTENIPKNGRKVALKKVGLSSYRVGIIRCGRVGGLIFLSRPRPPNNVSYVSTCAGTYKRLTKLTNAHLTMQTECPFKTRRYSLRLSDIESDHRVYSGFFLVTRPSRNLIEAKRTFLAKHMMTVN